MVGATIGALMAGKIAGIGRWKSVIVANIVLCTGSLLKLVSNFVIFSIGWSFHGFSAGLFSFLVPKYIMETAPKEVSGTFGGLA